MIRIIGTGTTVYGNVSASAPRPSVPVAFNDLELLIVGSKDTLTPATLPVPSGWTQLVSYSGGDGTTTFDQGPTRLTVFSRVATGGETGSITVSTGITPTAGTVNYVFWAHTMLLRADKGTISTYISNANIVNSSTTFSRTFNFNTNYSLIPPGAIFMALGVTATDTPGFTGLNISTAAAGFNWLDSTKIVSQPSTDTGLDIGGFVLARTIKNPPTSGTVGVTYGSDWTTKTVGPLSMIVFSENAPGATAAWDFNEASGNAISYGTVSAPVVPASGATRVADRAGVGRALSGGGDTGLAGGALVPAGATSLSMAVRFQYSGGSGDRGLMTLFTGTGSTDMGGVYMVDNKVGMWLETSTGFSTVLTNLALQAGNWYDVAVVWNGTVMRVWINGQLQGESSARNGNMASAIARVVITDGTSIAPVGAARVYPRAITEEEVVSALAVEPSWSVTASANRFPGATHSSGRYLLDTLGQPYFAALDSAWDLLHVANQQQRLGYLSSRASQGFNMAYVGVIRSDVDGSSNPVGRTPAGNVPFAGATPSAWNLASPNEAFWAEVDDALDKAESLGITLWLQILTTWEPTSAACYTNATDAQVRAFGAWLAARYKNRPNIVWLMGGDWQSPSATLQSRAEQLILGIRDGGDSHHFALHQVEESDGHTVQAGTTGAWTASGVLADQADLRPTYAYRPTYYRNRVAYAATPAEPVFLFEANYEDNPRGGYPTDAHVVRRQALWNLTSGGMGHGYGHGRVFNFTTSSGDPWTNYLTTTATEQLRKLHVRWRSMSGWQNLVPDTSNTLVTSGRGVERTTYVNEHVMDNDYVPAAITPDKSLAMIYVPSARAITLDLSKMGSGATVTRVDPTGETADANLGSAVSIPPSTFVAHADGTSDYLLQVTAAAAGASSSYVVQSGSLVAVTRYVVQGGALVPLA